MCRNIKVVSDFESPPTYKEIHVASLKFGRKVGRSTKPSQSNEELFKRAVEEVAKAWERAAKRFARSA